MTSGLEESAGNDLISCDTTTKKPGKTLAQKISIVPKPTVPVDLELNSPDSLNRMYASGDYIAVPLHGVTLLLLGRAFYTAQAHKAFARDVELFIRLVKELGTQAFRLTLDAMMELVSPETAALLERQRKESKLKKFGWLSTAPRKDFICWLSNRSEQDLRRKRYRKGKYAECVGLRQTVSSCPNFEQPLLATDTLFGARGHGVVDSAKVLNHLLKCARNGLPASVKKQAANDAVNRREKRGQGSKRYPDDGETFYQQFADVISKTHVLIPKADWDRLLDAFCANPKADVACFAPLYLLAYSENKPDDELAPSLGTLALALGRQGNATTYVTHQMGLKPGVLWGRFRLERIGGHESCYGKRPGFYCFYDTIGQTVRGVTTGGDGSNYAGAAFPLCPSNFGLHYDLMPMYQSTTYQQLVYDTVEENIVTKPAPRTTESHSRKQAKEYRDKVVRQLVDAWGIAQSRPGYLATALTRIITSTVDPQLKRWATAKGKTRLAQNLGTSEDFIASIAHLVNDPFTIPYAIRSGYLLNGQPVIDDTGNTKRGVVRQQNETEVFDARINQIVQPLLFDCNEKLGFLIHNFVPGIHTTSPECAGRLHQLMKDFRKSKERYGIFNLDVRKCFDTLDFSNPNMGKWLERADATLEEMGTHPVIRRVLSTMMSSFAYRIMNGSYQHESLSHRGRVKCGLILLPAFWVYLTLPLAHLLYKQRENGHLHFVSVCGDDFFAVTNKDIPAAVCEEIESTFNTFAQDLGLDYHYFKNYRQGEKGDTGPERYKQRRARTDGPWETEWPKHLPLVHGSIWVDSQGIQSPTMLNRIPENMTVNSLRNMIFAQMQLTPYNVPRLALQAAALLPFRELQEHPLDEESMTIQKMAREAHKKGGSQRRMLYGPGRQTSAAFLLLEANKDKLKWFDPYSIPDSLEEIPDEDSAGEEYVSPASELDVPLPVSDMDQLKSHQWQYRRIWSGKGQDFDTKQKQTTSLLHTTAKTFPKSQQRYPDVGNNENGYSRLQLKGYLTADETLLLGRYLETEKLQGQMPKTLEKVLTIIRDRKIWSGVTYGRPVALGPLIWLLTCGFTSAEGLTRYQGLNQTLLEGVPLIPQFKFYYVQRENQFVISKSARGSFTSLEDFKKQVVEHAFEIERIQRNNLQRRVHSYDVSDEVKTELLTSERLTRDISDSLLAAKHSRARAYLSQGKVEAAFGLCDLHSLFELLNLLKEFYQFCSKPNKKLKTFLEDQRSKTEGGTNTFIAWDAQRLIVNQLNTWLATFIDEERESRIAI